MARIPLTEEFLRRPFTLTEGTRAQLSRDRLLGRDLSRPTRSVRSAVPLSSVAERAWAFRLAMPDDIAFSHLTAARLWNLWLPAVEDVAEELHVTRPNAQNRIRRAGVIGYRGLENRRVELCRGMPVTSLEDTWLDLAPVLELDDLVILGDCVAGRLGSVQPLSDLVDARRRVPGRARAVRALPLIRSRSKSPMETRSRLLIVRAGLPEPKLNEPLHDAAGGWIAEVDFLWEEERVVGEYHGEKSHAGPEAREADAAKRMLVEDHHYAYVEMFKRDIFIEGRRVQLLLRLARHLQIDAAALFL